MMGRDSGNRKKTGGGGTGARDIPAVLVRDGAGTVVYERGRVNLIERVRLEYGLREPSARVATLNQVAATRGRSVAKSLHLLVRLHERVYPGALVFPGGEVRDALDARRVRPAGLQFEYLGRAYPLPPSWPDDPARLVARKNWYREHHVAQKNSDLDPVS